MREYFLIDGYYTDFDSDTGEPFTFTNQIVTNFDDHEVDENGKEVDIDVFEYGWSEEDIKQAIEAGDEVEYNFVITNYRKYDNR